MKHDFDLGRLLQTFRFADERDVVVRPVLDHYLRFEFLVDASLTVGVVLPQSARLQQTNFVTLLGGVAVGWLVGPQPQRPFIRNRKRAFVVVESYQRQTSESSASAITVFSRDPQ